MNVVLVETWSNFKLPSSTITQEYFKNTHLLPLYTAEKFRNHQACLASTQTSRNQKLDVIKSIAKARIAPTEME